MTNKLTPCLTETETQRQLDSANKRYDDLKVKIDFRLDDLRLAEQYIERDKAVTEHLTWVTATETNLERARPSTMDIEPLEREIDDFQVRERL